MKLKVFITVSRISIPVIFILIKLFNITDVSWFIICLSVIPKIFIAVSMGIVATFMFFPGRYVAKTKYDMKKWTRPTIISTIMSNLHVMLYPILAYKFIYNIDVKWIYVIMPVIITDLFTFFMSWYGLILFKKETQVINAPKRQWFTKLLFGDRYECITQ